MKACVEELLGSRRAPDARAARGAPGRRSTGSRFVEDIGHGLGDKEIEVAVEVRGRRAADRARLRRRRLPFYTNSYRANTTSAVYLGLVMFLQPEPPYNEGMYRPIEIDYGPPGTMVNAVEPAAHVASTTCPAETITDAVRDTLSAAYPERAAAGWGHCAAVNLLRASIRATIVSTST